MNKLYNPIEWENGTTPAINEDNLNAISQGLSDVDDRVIELGGMILEDVPEIKEMYDQIEELTTNPPYIGANGNWYVWDTETGAYVDSGVDASITVSVGTTTTLPAGSSATVTNTGTGTDPILNFGIPQGATGATGADGQDGQDGTDGVSPEVTITSITGGHRVTITDADHPSGQSFDVLDGSGSGDMTKATYDNDNTVANAGGIKTWVQSLGYITGLAWSALSSKPFSTVGSGLTVTSDTLSADVQSVSVGRTGTASASATSYQRVGVNGSYTEIDGTKYMESSSPTTANNVDTFTFTNAAITSDSVFSRPFTDKFGVAPVDMTVSGNTLSVSFNSSDSVTTCRVYLR